MSTCLDTLVKAVWPLSQRPPENVCKYYMQVHHNFEYDDNNKKMNDKRIKAITVSSSDKLQYKKQVFNKQTKRIWAWTIYKRINPIYMIQKQKIVCSGCYLWRWQTYPGRQGCFRLWIDRSSGVWWPGFAYLKGLMFTSAHAIKLLYFPQPLHFLLQCRVHPLFFGPRLRNLGLNDHWSASLGKCVVLLFSHLFTCALA